MFVMKKVLIVFLVLSLGMFSNFYSFTKLDQNTVYALPYGDFSATADTFIKNGADANKPYGGESYLAAKDVADSYGVDRISYVKVDFSGFNTAPSNVTSAYLWLYCTAVPSTGATAVTVSGFNDDSWSESTITWNARPTETGLTVCDTKTIEIGATGWYAFDVTSFVRSQTDNRIASFKITNQANMDVVTFSSKEGSQPPVLKLTCDTFNKSYDAYKDAHIQNGDPNRNYGDEPTLFIKDVDNDYGVDKISYVGMDFGSYDAYTATTATLKLNILDANTPDLIYVYGLIDDSWSERGTNGITWNHRPADDANGVLVACKRVTTPGWNSFDVTSFVNTQMASGDRKVTFKIMTSWGHVYSFSSKEAADPNNAPCLVLNSNRAGITAKDSRAFVDSIGINTHLVYTWTPYFGDYNTPVTGIKARITELGIRHLRDWSMRITNSATDSNTVYTRMKELSNLNDGLRFSVFAKLSPRPYTDASKLTEAYEGAGSTWEAVLGLNEPHVFDQDPNDPDAWKDFTVSAQKTIWNWAKSGGRNIPVVGPNMGCWLDYKEFDSLTQPDYNINSYMDEGDLHSYTKNNLPVSYNVTSGGLGQYLASVEYMRMMSGGKPYIVSETGFHNAPLHSTYTEPIVAAKHLTRVFFYNWNAGAKRTFIYELRDEGIDNNTDQNNFGILDYYGNPKPAFTAMKNMIKVLDDPNTTEFSAKKLNFRLEGDTQYVRYSLLQKRDGKFYLALWIEAPQDTTAAGTSKAVTLKFINEAIKTIKACRVKDTDTWSSVYVRPQPLNDFSSTHNVTIYDDVTLFEITK